MLSIRSCQACRASSRAVIASLHEHDSAIEGIDGIAAAGVPRSSCLHTQWGRPNPLRNSFAIYVYVSLFDGMAQHPSGDALADGRLESAGLPSAPLRQGGAI